MSLSLAHINDISKGIRGLCQGRVYLKEDCEAGDTTIPVGYDDGLSLGLDIPGSELFRNNTLSAVIVEPSATAAPGAAGIDHSESVTLSEPTFNGMDVTATTGLQEDYTVAAGAYIRMATLPTVCTGLKIIQKDFLEDMVGPEDKYLPGVFVTWNGSKYDPQSIAAYNEHMTFLVRYVILEEPEVDNREVLISGLEQLINLLGEDNYLGGTAHESNITGASPCWDSRGARRGQVLNSIGRSVLWGDIYLDVKRTAPWDKVSSFS